MSPGLVAPAHAARRGDTPAGLALVAGALLSLAACAASRSREGGRAPAPVDSQPVVRHPEVIVYPADVPAPDGVKGTVVRMPGARASGARRAAVPVRVLVIVPDWIVGRSAPIGRYPVLVIGPANDSTVARTDESGTATFALPPGQYRIAPLRQDPVARRQRYEWSLSFDVAPDATEIRLTEVNATERTR